MSETDYKQRQLEKIKRAQRIIDRIEREKEKRKSLQRQGVEQETYDSKD